MNKIQLSQLKPSILINKLIICNCVMTFIVPRFTSLHNLAQILTQVHICL